MRPVLALRAPARARLRASRALLAALPALAAACGDAPTSPLDAILPDGPSFAAEWRMDACYPVSSPSEPPHSAFPSLQRLDDGTLVVVYRSGNDHVSPNGAVVLRRSTDDGATWGAPRRIYRDPAFDARDPHLTVLPSGRWVLNFFVYDVGRGAPRAARVIVSDDEGATWGPALELPPAFGEWTASSDGVLPLGGDTLLLPVYGREPGEAWESARVMRSLDGGATWDGAGTLGRGGRDFQEPALARRSDGSVLGLIRTSDREFFAATSTDGGLSWSRAARVFAGSGSPHLLPLSSGRLLVSYRAQERGYPVGLRLSGDGGRSWGKEFTLDPGGDFQSTYSQVVELEPSRLGLVYGSETGFRSHVTYCSFSYSGQGPPSPPNAEM